MSLYCYFLLNLVLFNISNLMHHKDSLNNSGNDCDHGNNSDHESDNDNPPIEVPFHLKCQISQSLLIDPIMVPCCGRVFSRSSLEVVLEERKFCPVCFRDISGFDIKHAPKVIAIQDAIDAFIQQHNGNIEDLKLDIQIEVPKWRIFLKRVPIKGPRLTKIGQLQA